MMFDYNPIELEETFNSSDVAECSDVPTLKGWLEHLEDARDSMEAQMEAALTSETYDDKWMIGIKTAYTYASIGKKKIIKRLDQLGVGVKTDAEIASDLRNRRAVFILARAREKFGPEEMQPLYDLAEEKIK